MSATNRSDVRLPDDAYETPAWCVHRLFDDPAFQHTIINPVHPRDRAMLVRVAMDPCAGSGAIVRACVGWGQHGLGQQTAGWNWVLVEKRKQEKKKLIELKKLVPAHIRIGDFLRARSRQMQQRDSEVDLVITNPPYSLAQEFIEKSLRIARVAVVMLLRLNYLASASRSRFMRERAPDVYVLPNRPSFTGGGKTDATEYCWMVFYPNVIRREGIVRVLATTRLEERT